MKTDKCFHDTEVEINIDYPTLLPPQWTSRTKCGKISHLWTATQNLLCLEGTILDHVSIDDSCVNI